MAAPAASHETEAEGMAPLRAFSLTHVQYQHGDRLGFLMAAVTLSPIFIMVQYATIILMRRDLAVVALCIGQLANEAVNYALKHSIKEPRPASVFSAELHASAPKYGMPSDHAQFMGFFAAYLTWWALRCWRVNRLQRVLLIAAVQLAAGACAASRVYLGYHTYGQVAAGYGVGCITGSLWFGVVQRALRSVFPWFAGSAVGVLLQLRDCTYVADVLSVEYSATVAASAAALKTRGVHGAERVEEGGAKSPSLYKPSDGGGHSGKKRS